ncbi:Hsp33 family molecular chaperone HslO [Geobacter pickeringii]|uniref:33 kDa chaperonin n=1 Tax=Geobacter pickeringii TaxID=345632 RepID=A0A0B5BAL6_9BACT|nr:Hsp33 family molecular chaperone HslO [Geobacter pickeringii]AJE01999.1 heat shock protein Hsp33 [Geobacter pickeringii]
MENKTESIFTDYLVRAITRDGSIRALACVTTGLVADASRRHGTWPTASAALGRGLTAGALMGALLKTGQRVALRFEGNGPLKRVLVEADSNGAVRGGVGNPEVSSVRDDGKLDVGGALGQAGLLTVTKDLGLKEPYTGTVILYTSEIAEDLAYYLTESEQVPSAVGLGTYVEADGSISAAGGFLIQSLPPGNEELVERLMARIEGMPPVTELLRRGVTPEGLLEYLFEGIPFNTLEKRALAFVCSCSRERIERVLVSLGKDDLAALIDEQGGAEVTCELCRERYRFDRGELERLLAGLSAH